MDVDPRWTLALRAAAALAVDPSGLGGAILRGPPTPARDLWLQTFRLLLPPGVPWRRLPPGITDARLLGGLDLTATLATGRPTAERGLLAETDGGALVVPMAERLERGTAGHLAAILDTGAVQVERDGIAAAAPAQLTLLLLDEGIDDEAVPGPLAARVAFSIDLTMVRAGPAPDAIDIAPARALYPSVEAGDDVIEALAIVGPAFGLPSLRLATLALKTAKALAALAGRRRVSSADVEDAAALVIAPRATMLPAQDEADAAEPAPPPPPEPESKDSDTPAEETEAQTMADRILDATQAAIPADLLALLGATATRATRSVAGSRAGEPRQSGRRGRPAGTRRGMPGHGIRLAVVDTLRAAAPWQTLRRSMAAGQADGRILIRREDFRIGRFKQKSETLTIFVVDASGSAALHRLAEVKGAVELVLADCYVRRDGVALIAFRGERADLILPPTRSLVRAKRALAGLPGGGGTPLAAAIEAASLLAQAARKKGQMPLVVLMTDGKANIARSGRPGRPEAEADAARAAVAFRADQAPALVLDISPRPGEAAQRLAVAMGARYIPLPYADALVLSRTVLAAGAPR